MGDYYKIKKILLILIIVLTILRIFKTSNVFASEAVEVTPTWNDGSYTNQSDNNYLTLMNNQLQIQERIIINLLYNLDNNRTDDLIAKINNIRQRVALYWNGSSGRFAWFGLVTDSSIDAAWFYQEVSNQNLTNIVFADATLNNGYKITNVPFFSFSRSGQNGLYYFKANGTLLQGIASGTALVPCAECGYYSPRWVEVFRKAGLIEDVEYNDILSSIEETNELNYSANLYTKQAVQNTYSYLTNDTIETISTTGITQPQVTEKIDLTDVFDSLETLLTNENYVSKYFTFSLPGNRNFTFTLRPDYLETSLSRAGGQNIISIIHALWYIGLYGWYIFAYLGIFGKLLTGDWFHLVKGSSPITNMVKMSVGSITGGRY